MMTTDVQTLQRTPLYDAHVAAGGKMVPFGGWEMPLHYGSQIEEHHATRRGVGLFDVSHMGQIEVVGPEAEQLVQEIVTQDVSKLRDGDEVYTVMCRENGGMVDDLIVSRFDPRHFFIVVNAAMYRKDVEFMQEIERNLSLRAVKLLPCTEEWAMIAVQGPKWFEVCQAVLGHGPWEDLLPFRTVRLHQNGSNIIFSATGYTGEAGAEILCPPEDAVPLWEAMVDAGATPCGLAARDTLRLEKGYCLSGQDFNEADNPYEAGLGRVVRLNKPSFSGKNALARIKEEGVRKKLVGLLPEGRRMARHDMMILSHNSTIGVVTSGGFAPSLNRPVAMGYVITEFADPGHEVEIAIGGTNVKAKVVKPPFYPAMD